MVTFQLVLALAAHAFAQFPYEEADPAMNAPAFAQPAHHDYYYGKREADPPRYPYYGKREADPTGYSYYGKREADPTGYSYYGKREA